jgi:hypothetical protein
MMLLRECLFSGRVQVTLAPPLLHWPTALVHDLGRHTSIVRYLGPRSLAISTVPNDAQVISPDGRK